MKQSNLFAGTNAYGEPLPASPPYQPHSTTSREAAAIVTPRLNELQRQLLEYFQACGEDGSTDEEATLKLGWNPSTIRPRRVELLAAKLIKDSGKTRKTKSRRAAVVWQICLDNIAVSS